MLTKEYIKKVSRLGGQTGGFEGFYESNFNKFNKKNGKDKKFTIKFRLEYVELKSGDVVLQRK